MIDHPNVPGMKDCSKQKKPHVVLRTHDGEPTPPIWARKFKIHMRTSKRPSFHKLGDVQGFYWNLDAGIRAVEWLP